ncbi:protein CPR-5 [Euphorbia lathyris]|uniref:protein CPR-5 n=1 Tax=Euphorbia lathyris TaxID=212925 RepID=UPI003313C21D
MCSLPSHSTATATQESNATGVLIPMRESPPGKPAENGYSSVEDRIQMKKKKKAKEDTGTTSPSSSICSTAPSTQRSARLPYKRKKTRVLVAPVRRGGRLGDSDVEAAALPLGMSFAAIVAQVLGRKGQAHEKMSVDQLSKICTSAVRESLANVFGNKFEFFAKNFEKSFESTLRTLTLINEASLKEEAHGVSHLNAQDSVSKMDVKNGTGYAGSSNIEDCHSELETKLASIMVQNQKYLDEEVEDGPPHLNQELALYGRMNQQQSCSSSYLVGSAAKQLSTIQKSVMEQTRGNDLKMVEIGLTMKKLKLKEAQLALTFDSNDLERSKLAMGVSKASFRAEKFKTQLEDTRHTELLRKCIDCLVAGLFIMSASILYGAYVFSYQRITDATTSCSPLEESKSWWMPSTVSTFNSGWHTVKCHIQVASRMLFGILIILAVAYLLLQRTASSRQTMPITFILLLLGAACGLAGKFCVDTLGGNGLLWLLYWETFLFLHFLSNVCTSMLYLFLHGPLTVSQGKNPYMICPYWLRRAVFYSAVLFFIPLCCGLLPFAGLGEWKDHIFVVATDFMQLNTDEQYE